MDIKISDNDISLMYNGAPVMISGMDQAVQQVNLALKIPKYSFIYDRNAGAFDTLDFSENGIEKRIEARLNECLLHSGFYAEVDYLARNANGILIGITINNDTESCTTEVVVDG